jgi:hypothetical protein
MFIDPTFRLLGTAFIKDETKIVNLKASIMHQLSIMCNFQAWIHDAA